MKHNILYVHNKVDISGGERSLLNLWHNIDADKFNMHLIVPGEGPLADKARECGLKVFYSKAPKLSVKNFFSAARVFMVWTRYILKNRISLIHSYTPRNNILSGIIGKLLLVPVIWHERNMMYDDKFDVTRKFIFLPDCVLCNSRAIAERFRNKGKIPLKVRVVYNGVDLDRFTPSIDTSSLRKKFFLENKKVVGVVTNLSPRKRPEFFLEAAVKIKERYENVVFIIVGGSFPRNEDRMAELKERSFFLGIGKDVIFTGFQEDVSSFISLFDVSVNVTDKEACSRAIMESMACGKAVVAMKDGGSPELIVNGKDGILTHPMNMEDFADTVADLLRNDKKRKSLGAEARHSAEIKFNIVKNTLATKELYLSLIKKRQV